ncbi:MAG: endonuclease domain-containing protein [Acidobacteria bacterium]|nr:endonuclease domain-containing protein [Acidobacteriota bacterium]MCI0721493.1 endonuclease domain-containing protein [Acidobacteriota bacterium]
MPRRKIISSNPRLKLLARDLRHHSTLSEVLLWNQIKNKKMLGYDFHRQKPIDEFIVDFFCPDLMLAIEIDGESHWHKGCEDLNRQSRLERLGIHFIRFEDRMIKRHMSEVLGSVQSWLRQNGRQRQESPPGRGGAKRRGG